MSPSEGRPSGSGRKPFLVYVSERGKDLYLFVYDREVIEEGKFEGARVSLECSEPEVGELLRKSISVNFFGKRSVELGIRLGYVHPEGTTEINGVPCAIYIRI